MQTGRSQLRRYKSKKLLVSEGEAAEPSKPKSQILEFWLVRECCDKGSLMVCCCVLMLVKCAPHVMMHNRLAAVVFFHLYDVLCMLCCIITWLLLCTLVCTLCWACFATSSLGCVL